MCVQTFSFCSNLLFFFSVVLRLNLPYSLSARRLDPSKAVFPECFVDEALISHTATQVTVPTDQGKQFNNNFRNRRIKDLAIGGKQLPT